MLNALRDRSWCILFVSLFLFTVAVVGCGEESTKEDVKATDDAASVEKVQADEENTGNSEATSEAVKAVKASMTEISPGNLDYKTGSLKDGIAVLAGDAAYWVKDGKVYAANGFAKTYSPALDYSPSGIDFSSVEDATT